MNFIEPVKDLFITESKELLDRVEQVTLNIEQSHDRKEAYRELFRCIHSIKGSSGMFGFEAIEYFLHHFENLLDALRNEEIQATTNVIDTILACVDHARILVNKPGLNLTRAEKKQSEQLIETMNSCKEPEKEIQTEKTTSQEKKQHTPAQETEIVGKETESQQAVTQKTESTPKKNNLLEQESWIVEISLTEQGLLENFDPAYILQELKDIGWKNMSFIPGVIPDMISYDPEKPFGRWLIEFPGTTDPNRIEDVFTFVENELIYTINSTIPENTSQFIDNEDETESSPNSEEFHLQTNSSHSINETLMPPETEFDLTEKSSVETMAEISDSKVSTATTEASPSSNVQQTSIRVNIDVLEELLNLISELVLNRNQFIQLAQHESNHQLTKHVNQLNRLTSEIQETAMRTRMQAIGTSWTRLPRIVRDLSAELDKEVDLKMEGESTELDRQVMQHISEPMVHLIRNALDHGIEKREDRIKAGKTAKGRIRLNAYNRGGHIIIEVSDDGKGIDAEALRKKAVDKALLSKEQAEKAPVHQLFDFLFLPGFSTATQITKLSGRGVGLDVVRKNIEELGGSVEIQSEKGNGTTFKIKIPLTLAIISALIVKTSDHFYAIPEIGIQELVWLNEVNYEKVIHLEGSMLLTLRDKLLPLVRLSSVLGYYEESSDISGKHVVVIQNGELIYGLIVDQVDQIQEIVVKPLNRLLKSIQVYSGTTLIGSEQIVLILDVNGIATQAMLEQDESSSNNIEKTEHQETEEKTLFLLFRSGNSQKAVHLGLVARLEELPVSKLEDVDGRYVIQYRDHIIPLLEFREGILKSRTETVPVIVFQNGGTSFGLMVDGFSDIAEEEVQFEQVSKRAGILGMAVLNGKSTEVIDVNHFFEQISTNQHNLSLKEKGFTHVLLAERSDFLKNHIKSVLQAAGMQATLVSSRKEAIQLLKKQVFQLVIIGLELTDSDGFMLASSILNDPNIPPTLLLSISSHQLDSDQQKQLFTAHIGGYDKDIILATLHEVLEKNNVLAGL